MELYMHFVPPTLTVRPVIPKPPTLPHVEPPTPPETLVAPEGQYHVVPSANAGFPVLGSATSYNPVQQLSPMASLAPVAPSPPSSTFQLGSATSCDAVQVNGINQPAHVVRMSWTAVWFPPKPAAGLGGLLGKSGREDMPAAPPNGVYFEGQYQSNSQHSSSSLSSSPQPLEPQSVPFALSPLQGKWYSSKTPNGTFFRPRMSLRAPLDKSIVVKTFMAESASKTLAEKGKGGGETVRWAVWNMGKVLGWGEEGNKTRDAYARIIFTQHITCHAIIQQMVAPDRLDVVVGFSSGDLVWLDPIMGKFTSLNRGGILNSSSVISVHPDPRQPTHFLALFADSTILRFNLTLEEPLNVTQSAVKPWTDYFERTWAERLSESLDGSATNTKTENTAVQSELLKWKSDDWAAPISEKTEKAKDKNQLSFVGRNPVAAMKIGKNKINALSYSPDAKMLAVASDDGLLRIIDVGEERITDTFTSYFGAFFCMTWSPDSRLLAAGSEDDLIALFSPRDGRVIARCEGHASYVTCIAFDTHLKCELRAAYRFVSVGQDRNLIFWDFSPAALHKPRHHHPNTSMARLAAGSSITVDNTSQPHSQSPLESTTNFHQTLPRSEVPVLQPVMSSYVDIAVLTGVYCLPNAIVTMSRYGHIKFWTRPSKV
nr:hypothetical protein L203_05821 [Cryptococcus depauperatus CBS 7841]